MIKTIACATLLAASCAANAAVTWNFSYTGFLEGNTGVFQQSRSLNGSFSGKDVNRDGYLDKSEITFFVLNGVDYLGCAGDSNAYYKCGTDTFRYKFGGQLEFAAGLGSHDPEGYMSGGKYYIAGQREYDYQSTPYEHAENSYLWTEQTKFAITKRISFGNHKTLDLDPVLAVPEPGTWAMLAAGLLVVTGVARRRMAALPKRG